MIKTLFFIIVLTFTFNSFGQKFGKNIPRYEYRKWIFGTALGMNWSTYKYELNPTNNSKDIKNIAIIRRPGMSIQIPLISFNPHHVINFQIKPSITFHETEFVYQYIDSNEELATKSTRTEPTNINFPLYVKLNTMRLNNFSAFALGGFSYSYDLASQHKVQQTPQDPIIKMTPHDWQYHVGGGFEFYLPYFKLGIELKTTNGINNLLIQDDTFFSAPLGSLKSRVWWFSITFEA